LHQSDRHHGQRHHHQRLQGSWHHGSYDALGNRFFQAAQSLVLAGEVESIGKNVTTFKPGDEIFGVTIKSPMQPRMGTYAEYKCLPEDSFIVAKPTNATFAESAAIPYGGSIALHFLSKAKVHPGQRVLVYGASGSIGTSLVQLAKHLGAQVTGICSTANLPLVKSLGADEVINYTREDFTDRGQVYDVIFDAVPGGMIDRHDLKARCRSILAKGGTYITIDDERPAFTTEGLLLLKELVETDKYIPVIDRCYSLDQLAEAHRYVETGRKKGNVVVAVP
jgi:NADPH:quinone reductase-like Zn-dependent oxidoreductase